LIDGFPRELQQALIFEQNVKEFDMILQYNCP
jgi:adenylate kinase family enzyme